jgi:AcrR family transcriptional regulator
MRAIAKKAKVSLATPYNLFGSKREVVLAVMMEDERDFDLRFASLHPGNAIEHIFQALTLAVSYYTDDPEFYLTLWKAFLDTSGKGGDSLATPQRRQQSHALWHKLLERAHREGYLEPDISVEALERTLAHTFSGVMFSWTMGAIDTDQVLPAAGYGYALKLQGAATRAGRERTGKKIVSYQRLMTRRTRSAVAA